MKWFWQKEKAKVEDGSKCEHPVSYQVMLHEDTSAPMRITGIKCTQCGEVIADFAAGKKDRVA